MKKKEAQDKWEKEFDKFFTLKWNMQNMDTYKEMKSFIYQTIDKEVKEAREEIVRQLEMTIFLHEKERFEEPMRIIESLESKIRAFIRHEFKPNKPRGGE